MKWTREWVLFPLDRRTVSIVQNGEFAILKTACGPNDGDAYMVCRLPVKWQEGFCFPWFANAISDKYRISVTFKTLTEAKAYCEALS